jgi:hypothetical protein
MNVIGSLPDDKIKINGTFGEDCSNEVFKLNAGYSVNSSPAILIINDRIE